MAPINTDEAVGHTLMMALKSRLVIALLSACVAGPTGSYLSAKSPDPRIDSIMVMQHEIKIATAAIPPLQDTVRDLVGRTSDLEEWRDRLAYLPPKRKSIGRSYER